MVNDHTRSAENWKCVWYFLRLYIIYRVYVDSHSLGQLALAIKRTASLLKLDVMWLSVSVHCVVDTETHPRVAWPQVSERAGDWHAGPLQ